MATALLGKQTHVFFRNGAGSGVLASSIVVGACVLERVLRVFVISVSQRFPRVQRLNLPKESEAHALHGCTRSHMVALMPAPNSMTSQRKVRIAWNAARDPPTCGFVSVLSKCLYRRSPLYERGIVRFSTARRSLTAQLSKVLLILQVS